MNKNLVPLKYKQKWVTKKKRRNVELYFTNGSVSKLNLSTKDSLILGDELCSGTESDSALSIFMAGLERLSKIKCSFIFATHFHEIIKFCFK